MDYSSLLSVGTKRLTFSLPAYVNPPDVAIGASQVVPIVGIRFTLIDRQWFPETRKYIVVLKVSDESSKMTTQSSTYVTTVAPTLVANPYVPEIRNQGGYVKSPDMKVPVASQSASPMSANITSPSGVVVAVPVVLGIIAGLLGLGLIYLTIDKIEEVVDSPSVSIFMIAIALLILFLLWKQVKT